VELRLCPVRPRRRQCTARLPPPASSSVVESSQPDDGDRSATLLLVAFPLPSRSLLTGPDAISPCTRSKNSSSRSLRSHRKIARRAFSGRTSPLVSFDEVLVPLIRNRTVFCEFAFQVPVDVRTVGFMRD